MVLTFSTHGFTDIDGAFHLLPYYVVGDDGPSLRTISSFDLERWLGRIDARQMVMIIDACHSAANVEAGDFKPGPMGSRGLGQLAYDKGMRILAASQSDAMALESERLRHGFQSSTPRSGPVAMQGTGACVLSAPGRLQGHRYPVSSTSYAEPTTTWWRDWTWGDRLLQHPSGRYTPWSAKPRTQESGLSPTPPRDDEEWRTRPSPA